MVGWNYPPIGNLHDMIIESKLHPLTCLATLNGREKKDLLAKGVVLCKTLRNKPELLDTVGVSDLHAKKVMEEIGNL